MNRAAATAAVLDEMVAGIMNVKADKAVRLTPVGTETAKLTFPSDLPGSFMSKEGMRDAAKDLRRHAATLVEIADALDVYSNLPSKETDSKQDAIEATKREEREADARNASGPSFAEKFAAMQAEAQAAVFKDTDTPTVKSKWTCPEHGAANVLDRVSPKGREYGACGVPNCKEFERK